MRYGGVVVIFLSLVAGEFGFCAGHRAGVGESNSSGDFLSACGIAELL